jgi:arylsulfatase A-like enzyme
VLSRASAPRDRSGPVAVALALAGALLGACTGSDAGPLRPVTWVLGDQRADEAPVACAGVPTAEVGGERRPVLADVRSEPLSLAVAPAGTAGPVPVELEIPDSLQNVRLRLVARWISAPHGEETRASLAALSGRNREMLRHWISGAGSAYGSATVRPASIARAGERATALVELPSEGAKGGAVIEVFGQTSPEIAFTTRPLPVPRGARLRFGIGLDAAEAGNPPVAFVIDAIDEAADADLGSTVEVFRETVVPAGSASDRSWHDREVDLAPLAGRTVRLRFTNPAAAGADGASFALPLWSDPFLVAPTPPPNGDARRNLLLISLDTLRADGLGSYGSARPTSPSIDAMLAAEGTLFENAFAPAPHTAPSHATMLTGVDPCVHRVELPTLERPPTIDARALTLAEILRGADYLTAAFTEDAWVTAPVGFARGFGTFVEERGARLNEGRVEVTFARGLDWIRSHRDDPWFVFLHTYEVHEPYEPPPGYREAVAWDAVDGIAGERRALYDAEIRYTDDVVASVLAGLAREGLADRTVVVLTSDHGEQFGEHDLFRHDNSLYDALLRVPLIVRAPGLLPAGRRVPDPVGLLDVVPTALSLLGVAAPPGLQGRDLVPIARGAALGDRVLYATLPRLGLEAIRTPQHKLITDSRSGRRLAFDWRADRGEVRDISGGVPPREWTQADERRREHCEHGRASLAEGAPPSASPGERAEGDGDGSERSSAPAPLEPAVHEKLRALGYAD